MKVLPKPFKINGHLEWDGKMWQQGHYHQTAEKLAWLEKNRHRIPTPKINIGDMVSFMWDTDVPARGPVRRIGMYVDHAIFEEDEWRITFDVDWGGHIRWVREKDILGQVWNLED
jgi:hypothetical protein